MTCAGPELVSVQPQRLIRVLTVHQSVMDSPRRFVAFMTIGMNTETTILRWPATRPRVMIGVKSLMQQGQEVHIHRAAGGFGFSTHAPPCDIYG